MGREFCAPQTRSAATLPGSTPLLAAAAIGSEEVVELLPLGIARLSFALPRKRASMSPFDPVELIRSNGKQPEAGTCFVAMCAMVLGVDSLSILFNHPSFQKPADFLGFPFFFFRKKDRVMRYWWIP